MTPEQTLDAQYAARLADECSSGDAECNGTQADRILDALLRELGLTATADAYAGLNVWRA